jgi:hypothetical protein
MEWKVRIIRQIAFSALAVISVPAFSAVGHVYGGGSLGLSYGTIGNTRPQISYVSGVPIYDDYPATGRTSTSASVSVNGGYEFAGDHWKPAIAVGLGIYHTLVGYDFNGHVVETVTGDTPNTVYNYTYNMTSTRIMAEVQFTWLIGRLAPFINLGVGPGWNRANGYTEMPLSTTGFVALPPFQSNDTLNFTYQAGFGISTAFNLTKSSSDILPDRISIGYRYASLGQTSFGTRGPAYPYTLRTGSLASNDVYISYTHLV